MTEPAPDGESLEDFVARISDVLRFVFAQQRDDVVVLVGETDSDRELLPQLQAASPTSGLSRHPGFRHAQSGLRTVIYSRRGPHA
jgi:broad specificity phosphatase PhoE